MNAVSLSGGVYSPDFFEMPGFFSNAGSSSIDEGVLDRWRDSANAVFEKFLSRRDFFKTYESGWALAIDGVRAESLVEALAQKMRELDSLYEADGAAVEWPEKSREVLRISIELVERYIAEDDFLGLDDLLSLVDPMRLRKITAVSFLRSTFRVRSRLSSWHVLYRKTRDSLVAAGHDPDHVLRGM